MFKLRVHNFVVSLDGYASGEGQSKEAGFGHAQPEFLDWFGKLRIWRGGQPDGMLGPDEAIASAWGTAIGAEIMGRNKFRPTTGPWPDEGWPGWWVGGEEPPFHTPCFVMTHWEREPIQAGETTFYFVNGSPAEVLQRAQEAAGGLDVRLGGGPTTVNEFLAADSGGLPARGAGAARARAGCPALERSGGAARALRHRDGHRAQRGHPPVLLALRGPVARLHGRHPHAKETSPYWSSELRVRRGNVRRSGSHAREGVTVAGA